MRDSGLRMVFMGAESGSDETLIRMNKGGSASTEKTLAMAEKAHSYGIVPEFSFVLGNPPDPESDVHSTLAFIRKVKKVNPHTEIIMYVYTPVPPAARPPSRATAETFSFPDPRTERVQWQLKAMCRTPTASDPERSEPAP